MVSLLSVRKLTMDDYCIMSPKLRDIFFETYEEMDKICGDAEFTFDQLNFTFFRIKIDEQICWGYYGYVGVPQSGFLIQNEDMWHRFGGGEICQKPKVWEIEAELIEDIDPVYKKFFEWYLDETKYETDFSSFLIRG